MSNIIFFLDAVISIVITCLVFNWKKKTDKRIKQQKEEELLTPICLNCRHANIIGKNFDGTYHIVCVPCLKNHCQNYSTVKQCEYYEEQKERYDCSTKPQIHKQDICLSCKFCKVSKMTERKYCGVYKDFMEGKREDCRYMEPTDYDIEKQEDKNADC